MRSRKKRLSPGCHRLGKALREMMKELRIKNKMIESFKPLKDFWRIRPIPMLKLSPAQIEKGKQILNRMKIKYPLRRDPGGRMMKGEVIE